MSKKELLIVKLDAIGDYIIFRNFIEEIKKSEKFCDYDITILGNILWKDLSEKQDSDFIKNFVWITKKSLISLDEIKKNNPNLFSKHFDVLIHPTFSRIKNVDLLVREISANQKVAYSPDNSNQKKSDTIITDGFYNRLIITPNKSIHEFERHKIFFETLLEKKLDTKLSLSSQKKAQDNYAVIFPGASSPFKRWSPDNFSRITKYLKEKYNFDIKICGSSDDKSIAETISKKLDFPILDLTGTTSLNELVEIISNSKILITNDTSALHIAAATITKTVLISSGHHKRRFSKYDLNFIKELYPPFYIERWHGFIFMIGYKRVIKEIDTLIK